MPHAIPDGFHAITPHLIIKGAAEAIDFYKRAFGATELNRMPMPSPDGQMKIGHAALQIGSPLQAAARVVLTYRQLTDLICINRS